MGQKPSDPALSRSPLSDIVRKGSVITFITLLSRPLGYVREAIQAYLFGATALVDAFIVASNFPELIQTLFFTGATSAFLIPVCTKYMKDDEEYSRIFSTFLNISIAVTLIVSLIFFLGNGPIARMIAPGFTPDKTEVTRFLFVIMIPVITLHTVLSVIKAFLNAREHFAAPEVSGIVLSIVFISCALLFARKLGIYSLAIGMTLGSVAQIAIQIPYLKRFRIRYRPLLELSHPSVREAKALFTGALIATSIVPINAFVGRIIASYLPHGEVSSLSYAFKIFILPFSLFAVPVYTVMFSRISRLYHDRDWKGIFSHADSSMVLLCVTLIPCAILICTTGDICVAMLYERGAFTVKDTAITNRALFGYGAGLLFYALSLSYVRIFNAVHDVRIPALVGITSIALNALLASLMMGSLGSLGISLATSLVSFYNFVVLFILFKKKTGYRVSRKTCLDVAKALIAGIITALSILGVRYALPERPYPVLALAVLCTAIINGITFRGYYVGLLRRG